MVDDLKTLIRKARQAAGLSQSELARRIKTTPSTVSQWEAGTISPRDSKKLVLATVLNEPKLLSSHAAEIAMGPEGSLIPANRLPPKVAALVKPWLDKKCEIWRVEADLMSRTDIKRGYYAVVAPGDVAPGRNCLANIDGIPVFRLHWPPHLIALPDGPKPPDITVDKIRVFLVGKVVWSFPPPP